MITRRGSLTGITMRGTAARFAVDWSRIETIATPGDTEQQTIYDAVFDVSTSATVDYGAQAIVRPTHPEADVSQITWSTSDESIASIDATGKVTRVADGYIRITATDQHGAKAKSGLVHIYREAGVEAQTWLAWADGSAAKAISDAIDEAIETGDPAAIMPMYTSGNTRNPNCWAAELADLSCIDRNKPNAAFIGTSGGYSYAIQAGHYPDGTDTYVAMDGTVASVTVADSRRVGPTVPGYGPEIKIVRYSTALDAKFVPALLPPANLNDYFRHLSIGVPLICTDQEKKALVADLNSLGTWATAKVPTDARRLALYESAIVGDSGSPRFMPVSGRLMLISSLTYGGAGSGPNHSQFLSEILDAIDDMGGDVEDFEIADLSAWTNYADPLGAAIRSYNPVAYWPFDGDYTDVVGGLTATPVNGPSFAAGAVPNSPGSLSTPTTSGLSIAHSSSLDIGEDEDFCISFWVRPQRATSVSNGTVIFKGVTPFSSQGWGFYQHTNGIVLFYVTDDSAVGYGGVSDANSDWYSDGEWHHVLVGINRTIGRFYGWVDGALRFSSTGIGTSLANLGGTASPSNYSVTVAQGRDVLAIDELAIFKTAPTEAMAQAIYAAGGGT